MSYYSLYHPTEGRRLSRPSWQAWHWDGLPAHKQSPIAVLTGFVGRQTRKLGFENEKFTQGSSSSSVDGQTSTYWRLQGLHSLSAIHFLPVAPQTVPNPSNNRLYWRSVQCSNSVFSISRIFKLEERKSWRIARNPHALQWAVMPESALQLSFFSITRQITNIYFTLCVFISITRHVSQRLIELLLLPCTFTKNKMAKYTQQT